MNRIKYEDLDRRLWLGSRRLRMMTGGLFPTLPFSADVLDAAANAARLEEVHPTRCVTTALIMFSTVRCLNQGEILRRTITEQVFKKYDLIAK